MSVRFLLGASGSGKSRQIYNEIIQASIKEPERNFYLIVPEQYTMEAQRELVTMHPAGGMMNIDAIGMNRLAYRVFDELGISTGQVLEDFGKSMLIKKILCEQQDTLQVYGSYYDKLGFVDEMKSMMSEIFQYNIKQDTIDEIMEQIPEDSVVAGKMQDIRHIYEEFEAFAGERYIVAEQLVELLTRHVGQSKLVCGSSLYFDGFTGFTPVQLELVEKLMTCAVDGELVSLTPTEYDILRLLMEHPGQVFSPRDIYKEVWKETPLGAEGSVAVHIRHLREKIEINPGEPRYIKVIWGRGYKMEYQ